MTEREGKSSRRAFLKGGLALGGATAMAAATTTARAADDPAITELQPWTTQLGEGVDARPYGFPSKFEADVKRRNVPWLTADPVSSVNFTPLHELDGIITPNGLCFERHHAGIAEVDPAKWRLMIHGMVDKPLVFTLEDLKRFPRVNRIHFLECAANSGMEWRGAQLNGCQFTHGMIHNVMYTGVPLKLLLDEAGLKPAAVQGAGGLPDRVQDERRGAAPRARLSRPAGRARLGRQHVGQVDPPHRGGRSAVASP